MAKVILEGNFDIMPNQLIQKPRKENKNLCPKCQKKDNCEDFKRLEYVEVCEDYKFIVLCDTCIKRNRCSLPKLATNCVDNGNDVVNVLKECLLYKRDTFNQNKTSKSICDDCVKIDKCIDHKYGIKKDGCDKFAGEIVPALNYDIVSKHTDSVEQPQPQVVKEISVKVEVFKDIGEELKSLGFEKGAKSFNSLKSEYDSVVKIFNENRNIKTSLVDVQKVYKTTNEIYEKGLKFLRLVAEIFKQLNVTKYDDLMAENEELKVSFNDCKNTESALYKTLKTAIDKNQKNLDLMKENKDRISELLGQVSLCKDAIMEVRLGLPELLHHQSTDELNKVLLSSKDRISFGQRLLDEYKKEGL